MSFALIRTSEFRTGQNSMNYCWRNQLFRYLTRPFYEAIRWYVAICNREYFLTIFSREYWIMRDILFLRDMCIFHFEFKKKCIYQNENTVSFLGNSVLFILFYDQYYTISTSHKRLFRNTYMWSNEFSFCYPKRMKYCYSHHAFNGTVV